MEKMLHKLARQLDSLDEASLMSLWSKYATLTNRFEPTKRWEEACLVFSLIQAKHWKNQLFNYCWSQQRKPPVASGRREEGERHDMGFGLENRPAPKSPVENRIPCRVLAFKPPAADVQSNNNESDDEK